MNLSFKLILNISAIFSIGIEGVDPPPLQNGPMIDIDVKSARR